MAEETKSSDTGKRPGRRRRAPVQSFVHTGLPIDAVDVADPGDETQRNFRYQHAYGAILLIQARLGRRPYKAIWCEQHEDLLCERTDGRFDGWQIKTRTPENGPWKLLDESMVRSLGRFCELVTAFGPQIAELFFASNAQVDSVTPESTDNRRRGRCPQLFLDHIHACPAVSDVSEPFADPFEALQAETGTNADHLFSVLKRVRIVHGPSRNDFDAVVAFEHVAALPESSSFSPAQIANLRDALIMKVGEASSLKVTDGARHVHPLSRRDGSDPVLNAKRISTADFLTDLQVSQDSRPFQIRRPATLSVGVPKPAPAGTALRKKLHRGGLEDDQIEEFDALARSAEYHLLQEANRRPSGFDSLLTAVENTVLYEYRQAYLRAKQQPSPFGERLMIDIQDRLARTAESTPEKVRGQPTECLIGVAGLLADDCRIWFSERFPLEEGEDADVA